jgi:hypothetical protein
VRLAGDVSDVDLAGGVFIFDGGGQKRGKQDEAQREQGQREAGAKSGGIFHTRRL